MNVLIVDDELLVRAGIQSAVDWSSTEYTLAGDARTGADALSLIPVLAPVIVITDLVMPGMGGLELIERSRAAGYIAEFVILTSHRDFEFARQAVELDAVDYLLKHELESRRILGALDRAAATLRRRDAATGRPGHLGRFPTEDSVDRPTRGPETVKCVIAIRIDDYHRRVAARDDRDPAALRSKALALIDRLGAPDLSPRLVDVDEGTWTLELIASTNTGLRLRPEGLRRFGERLAGRLKTFMNLTVRIAIADGREKADPAPRHADAVNALDHAFCGTDDVVIANTRLSGVEMADSLRAVAREAAAIVSHGGLDEMRDALTRFERVSTTEHPDRSAVVTMMQDVARRMRTSVAERSGHTSLPRVDYDRNIGQLEARIADAASLSSLMTIMLEAVAPFASMVESIAHRSVPREIERVCAYITTHYSERMTLEEIAQIAGKSPGYFSTYFKRHIGSGLVEYVNRVRIEEARVMLAAGTLSVKEVAYATGFPSEKYFTRVFKRIVGEAPSTFRARNRAPSERS